MKKKLLTLILPVLDSPSLLAVEPQAIVMETMARGL